MREPSKIFKNFSKIFMDILKEVRVKFKKKFPKK